MKYKLFFITLVALSVLLPVKNATANTARPSAALATLHISNHEDRRGEILKGFLEQYDSPLAPYAKNFVNEADKNHIDWKLVAAIAGNESYFGQLIPTYSYNAWGFGVYGNNVRNFASWEEGITIVSQAIRTDYMDAWGAQNVYEIGAIYAEDPAWANKVTHYLQEIDEFESQNANAALSISI